MKEDYKDTSLKSYKYAFDNVMYRIKSCSHYVPGKELPSFEVETYNGNDKDGKKIRNGEIKYFRDHKGRSQRIKKANEILNYLYSIGHQDIFNFI